MGQSGNELIWETQFWVISDWGQSEKELIWENQFQGLLLSLGKIRERVDLGKSTQWGNYLIAKNRFG